MKYKNYYTMPIGIVCIEEEAGQITGLNVVPEIFQGEETELLHRASKQLLEYFAGNRKEFSLPLKLTGTEFQKKVWEELLKIPYGETRNYGEIAKRIGKPGAARAIGGANHRNPVMILVPCHRVIGADGSLTGFGAGMEVKKYLLELEGFHG